MYACLNDCLLDLEKHKQLVRIKEVLDPHLEMASVHRRLHKMKGPAVLFENVSGSPFRAVSNIFGTLDRCRFIFRDSQEKVEEFLNLNENPMEAINSPLKHLSTVWQAFKKLPSKKRFSGFQEISLTDLPQIKSWPEEDGTFITLPQVYIENPNREGGLHGEMSMMGPVQLSGNKYVFNEELGLLFDVCQTVEELSKNTENKALKVSIFIGGPPAHNAALAFPPPKNISEVIWAGALNQRGFQYCYDEDGFCISKEADFIITGFLFPDALKPSGIVGGNSGYYEPSRIFPVLKINKIYGKPQGIWQFSVFGLPPHEYSVLRPFIHKWTASDLKRDISGLSALNMVEKAGENNLLLANVVKKCHPQFSARRSQDVLSSAFQIMNSDPYRLTKFLWVTNDEANTLDVNNPAAFFQYILERIDWRYDVHFRIFREEKQTDNKKTEFTENRDSQVIFIAEGQVKRELGQSLPASLLDLPFFENPRLVAPGILAIKAPKFENYARAQMEIDAFCDVFIVRSEPEERQAFPLIIITDETQGIAEDFDLFLWLVFSRCRPTSDIYGVSNFYEQKHWGCRGPLIMDARVKPGQSPVLEEDPVTEAKIDRLFEKGGSLYDWR